MPRNTKSRNHTTFNRKRTQRAKRSTAVTRPKLRRKHKKTTARRARVHTRRNSLNGGYSYGRSVKSRKTWSPKRTQSRAQTKKTRAKSVANQMRKMVNGDKQLANALFKLADDNGDNVLTRQELTSLLIAT